MAVEMVFRLSPLGGVRGVENLIFRDTNESPASLNVEY